MAALIPYAGYVALAFLPPFLWLLFYLHEDRRPEPKYLILYTANAGVIAALVALAIEAALFAEPVPAHPNFCGLVCRLAPGMLSRAPVAVFLGIGLIEEYIKYLAVYLTVMRRPEFDEPVDAMIYLVTAALGFAAIENVLFLLPIFEQSFLGGFQVTVNRFLGANLLHALSSGIVGYALARHLFSPWRRHALAIGIAAAAALHGLFNFLIIKGESIPQSVLLLMLLLVLMAIDVFADFERLKRREPEAPAPTA